MPTFLIRINNTGLDFGLFISRQQNVKLEKNKALICRYLISLPASSGRTLFALADNLLEDTSFVNKDRIKKPSLQ